MVNSGTGHDRCPSVFPGPSGAREPPCGGDLEITKTVFGFKRGVKIFCPDLDPSVGALRSRGQGRLDGAPLRRGDDFAGPAANGEGQPVLLLLPTGDLGSRAFFQCARSASRAIAMLACSGSAFSSAAFASAVARSRRCRIHRDVAASLDSLAARWEKRLLSAPHAAKATFIDGRDGLVEEAQSEV